MIDLRFAKQPVGGGLHGQEGFADRQGIGLPHVGQFDALGQPFEQLHVQMLFQQADLLADCSGGQVQLIRSRAERAVAGGGFE